MSDREPTTQELRLEQSDVERAERAAADQAPEPEARKAAQRRADKAAYLRRKLDEQEAADTGDGG